MREPSTWSLHEQDSWPLRDREDFMRLHRAAVAEHRALLYMKEIPGASDSLWRLHDQGIRIHVATSRVSPMPALQSLVVADTVQWLSHQVSPNARSRIPCDDLSFVECKSSVRADLYVDDNPAQLGRFAEAGLDCLVFDTTYNRDVEGPRAHGWVDAEAAIAEAYAAWKAAQPIRMPTSVWMRPVDTPGQA